MGIGALSAARWFQSKAVLYALVALPLIYSGNVIAGFYDPRGLLPIVERIDPQRAGSLGIRFFNQAQLVERALERPVLGWGGWGRHRIRNEEGEDVSVTDGAWIIILGKQGFLGFAAFLGSFLLAPFLLVRRISAGAWTSRRFGAAAGLAVLVILHMIDYCFNGSISPPFVLASGSVAGLAVRARLGEARLTSRRSSEVARQSVRAPAPPDGDLPVPPVSSRSG
jgi:hypothetical protein